MNRRMCRQVLDCGDGVREVTALAVKLLKILKRANHTATTPKAATSKTPSPQSKTPARRIHCPAVHDPNARSKGHGGLPGSLAIALKRFKAGGPPALHC